MSNDTGLSGRIAELANETPEFDGKARVLNQSGARIDQLIDEIDRTLLASALTFDTGKARVTLHVAGRRLHMICDADGSLVDGSSVFSKPLTMEDEALRTHAAALLQDFVANGDLLAVVSEPSTLIDGDAPDSMSIDALRSACGIDTIEDSELPQMDRFIARASDHMSAWIQMNGNRLGNTSGNVANISSLKIALTTQLSTFEQNRLRDCPSHTDPSMTCFLDAAEAGQSLGIAVFENGKLLFSAQTSEIKHVYRAFRQIS